MKPENKQDVTGLRGRLASGVAKMGAHRKALGAAREQLVSRAQEQLDSMRDTIATLEQAVEAGKGDILCQRRLRTLLSERQRLQAVIDGHRARKQREADGG